MIEALVIYAVLLTISNIALWLRRPSVRIKKVDGKILHYDKEGNLINIQNQ